MPFGKVQLFHCSVFHSLYCQHGWHPFNYGILPEHFSYSGIPHAPSKAYSGTFVHVLWNCFHLTFLCFFHVATCGHLFIHVDMSVPFPLLGLLMNPPKHVVATWFKPIWVTMLPHFNALHLFDVYVSGIHECMTICLYIFHFIWLPMHPPKHVVGLWFRHFGVTLLFHLYSLHVFYVYVPGSHAFMSICLFVFLHSIWLLMNPAKHVVGLGLKQFEGILIFNVNSFHILYVCISGTQ